MIYYNSFFTDNTFTCKYLLNYYTRMGGQNTQQILLYDISGYRFYPTESEYKQISDKTRKIEFLKKEFVPNQPQHVSIHIE